MSEQEPLDLTAIQGRLAAAEVRDGGAWGGKDAYDALIVHAPMDLTALVAEVERLRGIGDETELVLKALTPEMGGGDWHPADRVRRIGKDWANAEEELAALHARVASAIGCTCTQPLRPPMTPSHCPACPPHPPHAGLCDVEGMCACWVPIRPKSAPTPAPEGRPCPTALAPTDVYQACDCSRAPDPHCTFCLYPLDKHGPAPLTPGGQV